MFSKKKKKKRENLFYGELKRCHTLAGSNIKKGKIFFTNPWKLEREKKKIKNLGTNDKRAAKLS